MIIDALTKTSIERSVAFNTKYVSDIDLIRKITDPKIDKQRLEALIRISGLLRLMHSYLIGRETGEGFVYKFTRQWSSLAIMRIDVELDTKLDNLDYFYSKIQHFSPAQQTFSSVEGLIGLESLTELTKRAYNQLKDVFLEAAKDK